MEKEKTKKASCCQCQSRHKEQLYIYHGEMYCIYCLVDALMSNGTISDCVSYGPCSGEKCENIEDED